MIFFGLLPFITTILFTILLFYFFKNINVKFSRRESFLVSVVTVGLLIHASTQFFSVFHWIHFPAIFSFWVIVVLILLVLIIKHQAFQEIYQPTSFSFTEILLLGIIGTYILVLGVAAWTAPPNTWDSMAYHMSRIMHWEQNQSVDFYPTSIMRQLWANPLAEYFMLHLQILTGSDRLASGVQFLSMLTSLMAVSILVKNFGGNRRAQLLAMIFVMTIPMGILQATSTKNDYVLTMWLCIFVVFVFRLRKQYHWLHLLVAASSLALGCLTKGLMYIYAFPFAVMICLYYLFQKQFRRLMILIVVFLSMILLINGVHFVRNWQLGRHILTPTKASQALKNETMGWGELYSQLLRSSALHLFPPIESIKKPMEDWVYAVHEKAGLDTNNPKITTGFDFHLPLITDEDYTGNFLHFILGFIVLVILIFVRKSTWSADFWLFLLSLTIASGLFLCCIKWQVWQSRLTLALFVLASVFLATVLGHLLRKQKWALVGLAFFFALFSVRWLLYSKTKPLVGSNSIFTTSRFQQYFYKPYALNASTVEEFVDFFNKDDCRQIGLDFGSDSWEYPWWVALKYQNKNPIRIEHIDVNNQSSQYSLPLGSFSPCGLIQSPPSFDQKIIIYNDQWFIRRGHNKHAALYQKI